MTKQILTADIQTTVTPLLDNPCWDWRIETTHPQLSSQWQQFVSGGTVAVEAAMREQREQISALIAALV